MMPTTRTNKPTRRIIDAVKRKKCVQMRKMAEQDRVKRENELQEMEKRREWVRDAIELGAIPVAQPAKGLPRAVPKDLE